MTLREVKPFDTKQWDQLQENLKAGATSKQVANLERAQEHVTNAKVTRNY